MRSAESLYHKDSNMLRQLSKVKPCSAGIVLGWLTKYEYPVLFIQQIVTLSKYGHDALDIYHP